MRFCVSVPVLSVQITVADPSVSTLGRWRTSVRRLAIRRAPMAIARVTVGSKPSGTFATMMPIEKTRPMRVGRPTNAPMTNTRAPMVTARTAMRRLRVAISFCSGDGTSAVAWVRRAMPPKTVCMPVANTSAVASPVVSDVPASRTLRLRSRSFSSPTLAFRETGRASPVTVARFARTPNASIRRQSAGTLSPALNVMTSPGTISSDGITTTAPSRCVLT